MRIILFYHSLISDWNHGNAHFLRGMASELIARGHDIAVYEPENGWSLSNLVSLYGHRPVENFEARFPLLRSTTYNLKTLDLDAIMQDADLVLVHEWNDPELIARIGEHHRHNRGYRLLFHDTHHRSLTEGDLFGRIGLEKYDGVLAYGSVISKRYLDKGWAGRVWVWHEAADVRTFHPVAAGAPENDIVWVGNWGDEERTRELHEFLIEPARRLRLRGSAFGVRYPGKGIAAFRAAGIDFSGWIPNYMVPEIFAQSRVTVHIPRRPYVKLLPGIPTIRPFEALACGIPLVCSPWEDTEGLFTPGKDYLVARDGDEMVSHLRTLLADPDMAAEVSSRGLRTVLSRHTCGHRVDELLTICNSI